MYIIAVFIALAVVAQASAKISLPSTWEEFSFMNRNSMDNLFGSFMEAFEKNYSHEGERAKRFEIFVSRAKNIFDWNDRKNADKRTFLKGLNKFSDMTPDERKGFVMPETKADVRNNTLYPLPMIN